MSLNHVATNLVLHNNVPLTVGTCSTYYVCRRVPCPLLSFKIASSFKNEAEVLSQSDASQLAIQVCTHSNPTAWPTIILSIHPSEQSAKSSQKIGDSHLHSTLLLLDVYLVPTCMVKSRAYDRPTFLFSREKERKTGEEMQTQIKIDSAVSFSRKNPLTKMNDPC